MSTIFLSQVHLHFTVTTINSWIIRHYIKRKTFNTMLAIHLLCTSHLTWKQVMNAGLSLYFYLHYNVMSHDHIKRCRDFKTLWPRNNYVFTLSIQSKFQRFPLPTYRKHFQASPFYKNQTRNCKLCTMFHWCFHTTVIKDSPQLIYCTKQPFLYFKNVWAAEKDSKPPHHLD